MKVFISGASGLLGSNCLKYFKEQGIETIGSHLSFPTKDTVYFDSLNQSAADSLLNEALTDTTVKDNVAVDSLAVDTVHTHVH